MASPKQKARTPRETPTRILPPPLAALVATAEPLPSVGDPVTAQGHRIALAGWLLAFVLLCTFVLWDVINALLFR